MQFSLTAIVALFGIASASPLVVRGGGSDWGSCPADSQYSCTAVGAINLLSCASILNGNTIRIPIDVGSLGERKKAKKATKATRRGGSSEYNCPPDQYTSNPPTYTGGPPEGSTCCTTVGLVNALSCVSILNGNKVSIPLSLLDDILDIL